MQYPQYYGRPQLYGGHRYRGAAARPFLITLQSDGKLQKFATSWDVTFELLEQEIRCAINHKGMLRLTYRDAQGDDIRLASNADLRTAQVSMGRMLVRGGLFVSVERVDEPVGESAPELGDEVADQPSQKRQVRHKKVSRVMEKKARKFMKLAEKKVRKAEKRMKKLEKQGVGVNRGRFASTIADEVVSALMSDETGFLDAVADRVATRLTQGPVPEHTSSPVPQLSDTETIQRAAAAKLKELTKATQHALKRAQKGVKKVASDIASSLSYGKCESRFVSDVNVPDGSVVMSGDDFVKQWELLNSGKTAWPRGCKLKFTHGSLYGVETEFDVPCAKPGETVIVSALLHAPHHPGRYMSVWRLSLPNNKSFGHNMWCDVIVEEQAHEAVVEEAVVVENAVVEEAVAEEPDTENIFADAVALCPAAAVAKYATREKIAFVLKECDGAEGMLSDVQATAVADLAKICDVHGTGRLSRAETRGVVSAFAVIVPEPVIDVDKVMEELVPEGDPVNIRDIITGVIWSHKLAASLPASPCSSDDEEFVLIDVDDTDTDVSGPTGDITAEDDVEDTEKGTADAMPTVDPSASAQPSVEDAFAVAVESHAQQVLFSMGFCCREENEALLQKHKGNVQHVVHALLERHDNDWAASRR